MRLFPDTLGLIGFDAEGWTRMTTPTISAIITPAYQEGVRAMEELADILDGKKTDGEVVFKNIVKWRETRPFDPLIFGFRVFLPGAELSMMEFR